MILLWAFLSEKFALRASFVSTSSLWHPSFASQGFSAPKGSQSRHSGMNNPDMTPTAVDLLLDTQVKFGTNREFLDNQGPPLSTMRDNCRRPRSQPLLCKSLTVRKADLPQENLQY